MTAKKEAEKPNLRPLHDKVLVRPLSDDELGTTSPSGIIIPDTVDREKTDRGEVVAVGPGRWDEDGEKRIPVDVAVGELVIFQWGDKIEYEGTEYYLVSESNISAVINK
jgi:chaperonin GroES